jgi:phosphopentomutase
MVDAGVEVLSIGKIFDIMAGIGISQAIKAGDNMECMDRLIETTETFPTGLVMVNLVDFDMLWGHRNDFRAFAKGLEQFDNRLEPLVERLRENDLLIITADHGCDPTTESTDHSREYVPLLAYYKGMPENISLGTRQTFADTGKTIAEIFKIDCQFPGTSFLSEI